VVAATLTGTVNALAPEDVGAGPRSRIRNVPRSHGHRRSFVV